MPPFDHFSLLASRYDRLIQPKDPADLWRLADLPTAGALLDAGGGTGRIAQFMLAKASQVVVADLSRGMLAEARKKPGLQAVCSHTGRLPFAAATFARILMVDALHHVIDQPATIAELWRALQPGGRLVIEEPDIRTLAVKLIAVGEKLLLMRSHFLSAEKIAALFNYPEARVWVERKETTCWVVAVKAVK